MKKRPGFLMLCWMLWPVLWLAGSSVMAQTPQATDLPGRPFFIKKTWRIGGEGNWDYLTLDPVALQLYIAHSHAVQVVDVNAGSVSGEVTGLREAHGIALDSDGQFGYVSDGPANEVKVFDRRSLELVASIPTGKNPRAVVFEPASRLVFVVCPDIAQESVAPRHTGNGQHVIDPSVKSTVTVIDAQTRTRLADLMLPGRLGFAQTDGNGMVYVNITDRNQIAYFNAQDFDSRLKRLAEKAEPDGSKPKAGDPVLTIDWSSTASAHDAAQEPPPIPSPLALPAPRAGVPVAEGPGRRQHQSANLCRVRQHEDAGAECSKRSGGSYAAHRRGNRRDWVRQGPRAHLRLERWRVWAA